jgi:hypothetical protein
VIILLTYTDSVYIMKLKVYTDSVYKEARYEEERA